MIDQQTRRAIYCLYQEGMKIREISRRLHVDRNTVRTIISRKGEVPNQVRKDKIIVDDQLLHRLYAECEGYIQRIHEKLTEEEGVKISYPTLVRLVRKIGLSSPEKDRCDEVGDIPGEEMQHDTSDYKIKIAEHQRNIIASLLYFRYSKMRYLKFYRSFNRFRMKCFFHEALMHFGYSANTCIIDNTNLARLRGTGKNAIITAEMDHFSKQYSFRYVCHEIGHSNRKAGEERSFHTVETNFFPGRLFKSLNDMNKQAYLWATERMPQRRQGKSKLIPAIAFEYEKPYLNHLISGIPAPYQFESRLIDQYGYISYRGHFYWVPGQGRHRVTVLEYNEQIEIYHNKELLIKYLLPMDDVKNQVFRPKNNPLAKSQPNNRKRSTVTEEKNLRLISDQVNEYLNFIFKQEGIQRHRFVRYLYGLSKKVAPSLFSKALQRAFKYKITEMQTIERICTLIMKTENRQLPFVDTDKELFNRKNYIDGQFCDEVDLTVYDKLLEDHDG